MIEQKLAVIVLAAGEGTRMKSSKPKVMHELAGLPLLGHALTTADSLGAAHVVAVIRHQKELVAEYIQNHFPQVLIAVQDEQPGTGRAVECALDALPDDFNGAVVVTSGDVPLLDVGTLEVLLDGHLSGGYSATVLSTILDDASGYGRIVRGSAGDFLEIVEHRDASEDQLEITEVNAGVYVFDARHLREALKHVGSHNAQREKYLTDAAKQLLQAGHSAHAVIATDHWLVAGINDRVQLGEVSRELNRRICEAWQLAGVTILDPDTTWIDVTVQLSNDVVLYPGTYLRGLTKVDSGAEIGPEVVLEDTWVAENAKIIKSQAHAAKIGANATVGPFAYLRPGTDLGADGKIGTFVETKNAVIGSGSKVPHLSYVGDAEIGEGSNIGAGTIFANYDGITKSRSIIGSQVRTGSNNVFVAPVSVGDGAYTAAGTVVRRNVEPGALAVNVSPQKNVADWVLTKRQGTKSAEAAQSAKNSTEDSSETEN